jgi:hypothetical protein
MVRVVLRLPRDRGGVDVKHHVPARDGARSRRAAADDSRDAGTGQRVPQPLARLGR